MRVIADSDIVQEFMMDCDPHYEVELRVLLPDYSPVNVNIRRHSSTSQLYTAVEKKLNMCREVAAACAIFEIMDGNFGEITRGRIRKKRISERKLSEQDVPHQLYIQNYSSATSSCLILKKWVFNIELERKLCQRDGFFQHLVYLQAVSDVAKVGKSREETCLF